LQGKRERRKRSEATKKGNGSEWFARGTKLHVREETRRKKRQHNGGRPKKGGQGGGRGLELGKFQSLDERGGGGIRIIERQRSDALKRGDSLGGKGGIGGEDKHRGEGRKGGIGDFDLGGE